MSTRRLAVGISADPRVAHGAACVAGTSVPVWLLAARSIQGVQIPELLHGFPELTRESVSYAFSLAASHPDQVLADARRAIEPICQDPSTQLNGANAAPLRDRL